MFSAPSAPTISSITASDASLSVAFTAGAINGSPITSYKYSTDGGTTFMTRAAGTTASPLVISTLSTNGTSPLVNGTTYNIQIKAVNAIGDGTATSSTAATPRMPAVAILVTTQPVGGTSGAALATQPVVRIVDSTNATVTYPAASITVTASGGTLGGTTTITTVNGVATFTNLWHRTAGTYTLTFAATSLTSATSSNFTTSADTCATGGTCYVGNTGPGGGTVFYAASGTFTSTGSDCNTSCKYLETTATDELQVWSTAVNACYNSGSTSSNNNCETNSVYSGTSAEQAASRTASNAIGMGMSNTNQIYSRLTTVGGSAPSSYAAGIAWAYSNNGKSDWFMPSRYELHEICKWARNQHITNTATTCNGTGVDNSGPGASGFGSYYFSSSEFSLYQATQMLFTGVEYNFAKIYGYRFRPVRAFSASSAIAVTTQPVGSSSGAALATQPVVRIVDAAGNTVTHSSASVTVTASGGTLSGTTTVTAVNGVATFTDLTHATAGSYTLTFASTSLTSVTSASFTTAADLCSTGGNCFVGNTGPGGGKVFYVAASNFTSTGSACGAACKYLEAAPISWSTAVQAAPNAQTSCSTAGGTAGSATADPQCVWSGNTSTAVGATSTAIGGGYANTSAIIAQANGGNTAGKAATVARGYQGGSKTDWYLPSKGELIQMRTNNSYLGGYTNGMYWSSTEVLTGAYLEYIYSSGEAWTQKTYSSYVRPIRAFSASSAVAVTTQPVGSTSGALLATQPVVRIVDAVGNTVSHSNASVTVSASGGTLGGTTTVTAVNGVATFTNLTHTSAGTYTLTFTSTSPTTLTSATSASFTTAPQFDNGHVVFSYLDSMIYQQVVVSDMANTVSQTISFKARNAAQGPDPLSVFVNLYNSGGDVLAARVECPHAALTDSYQTFSCVITPASVSGTLQGGLTWSQIGRITVEVNGGDFETWGGNYGTVVDYVSLVATKANGTSSEQLLNHDFNTVVNFAPSNWTISGESWAACSGLYTSTLCVGFEDRPYHENYTTSM